MGVNQRENASWLRSAVTEPLQKGCLFKKANAALFLLLSSPPLSRGPERREAAPGASGAILLMGAQGFLYLQISKAFLHATFYQLSEDNANPLETLPFLFVLTYSQSSSRKTMSLAVVIRSAALTVPTVCHSELPVLSLPA